MSIHLQNSNRECLLNLSMAIVQQQATRESPMGDANESLSESGPGNKRTACCVLTKAFSNVAILLQCNIHFMWMQKMAGLDRVSQAIESKSKQAKAKTT
jgi:hypothetical protein